MHYVLGANRKEISLTFCDFVATYLLGGPNALFRSYVMVWSRPNDILSLNPIGVLHVISLNTLTPNTFSRNTIRFDGYSLSVVSKHDQNRPSK